MGKTATAQNVVFVASIVVVVVTVGLGIGLSTPVDATLHRINPSYAKFSSVVGWTYFAAWSVSFYPQLYLNWMRRSVAGLSLDFELYNLVGFTFYSIYSSSFFWNGKIQAEYIEEYGTANDVQANDVFFALHAVAITLLTLIQCVVYDRAGQKISRTCLTVVGAMVSIAVIYGLSLLVFGEYEGRGIFSWLTYLYVLSLFKLIITLIKYVPQAWLNFKRQSTEGWSIENILLDFTGGSLSMLQSILNAWVRSDWTVAFGNPVRPLLGLYSIFFDILFILQHYVWYRNASDKAVEADVAKETEPLIPDAEQPDQEP